MKGTIVGLCVITLLITTLLPITVLAGDEEDPEITDNLNDHFGALVEFSSRIRTRIALALLQIDSFDFIDIDSAWFYENPSEPEQLYTTLKLKDLTPIPQRAIYTIHWKSNGVPYTVWAHLHNNEQSSSCFVGVDRRLNYKWQPAEASYDFDNNIIIFKMDKEYIGNPRIGDCLTNTFAWTALRFNPLSLNLVFSDGELVKDAAPFLENNLDFGRNYIIQY
jgi:hypothetical protein